LLHAASVDRIHDIGNAGELLLRRFNEMATLCEEEDLEGVDLSVVYFEEDDEYVPGTYMPELHLTVRKINE